MRNVKNPRMQLELQVVSTVSSCTAVQSFFTTVCKIALASPLLKVSVQCSEYNFF